MIRGAKGKLPAHFFWHLGIAFLVLLCIGLITRIWLSGGAETSEAFNDGRRLVLRLDNNAIEGKQVDDTPAPVAAAPAATPPATTPPPAAATTPPATAPATPAATPPAATTPPAEAPPPQTAPAAPAATPSVPEQPAAPLQPAAPVTPETPPAAATPPTAEQPPAPVTPTAPASPDAPPAPEAPPAPATPPPAPQTNAAPEPAPVGSTENPVLEVVKAAPVVATGAAALPAPNPLPGVKAELTEKSNVGPLPIIGADGTKPWRYYAKSFTRQGSQPMIAIVVTGLGYNKTVVDTATRLHENITLSFSPYARDIAAWGATARATGHEIMLDLPMEPSNYPVSDPGPYGLLIEKGPQENENRLQWNMSRLSAYVGFLTPQNEAFSNNDESFKLLLQSLANRGLLLAIGREFAKSETKELVEQTNTATVVSDVLIDEDLSPAVIQTRLATLEQLAKKRGYAVGVARAYPVTLEQLRVWSEALAQKGFMLVPVTAVARLHYS